MGVRAIAIDWSGAVRAAHKIWVGTAEAGRLRSLWNAVSREAVAKHLVTEAKADPHMVVGLDFAFSLPGWFLEQRGLTTAYDLWELASRECETWLAACEPPF